MYIYVAAALAALLIGFTSGWKVQAWRHDSAQLAAAEQQRETDKMRRQATNSAAGKHEADKVAIRRQSRITNEETQHAAIAMGDKSCLTDGGLRALQDAISRANGDASKPGDTVPAGPASK